MAVAPVSKIKLVVVSADGAKLVLTPAEFARMRLQPGMKVAVLDETTGHTPKGLTAKTQGQDLLLELPEHGLLAKVEGFEQIADFSFAEDINAITTAQHTGVAYAQAAAPTTVATDAGGAAADTASAPTPAAAPAPASGTVGGFSLSTLGAILGGLALAGGGGGGGGAVVSAIVASASGIVIDGYLSGSTVTRANGSGNSVTTDENGRFTGLTGTGPIKVTGGYQLVGGQLLPFEGTLVAPEGSKVVTPITTLIQAALTANNGMLIDAATDLIKDKLNLPDSFDVLNVDPIAQVNSGTATPEQKAAALEVFKTGVAVATALQVAADGNTAAFTTAVDNLLTALETSTSTESGVQVVVANLSAVGVSTEDVAALQDGLTAIDAINVDGGTAGVGAVQGNTLVQTTDQGASVAATFTASVQDGAVAFGGSALGAITINVAANGTATFARQGTTATTTVDGLLDSVNYLDILSPAGAALNFNFAGGTADEVVAISAPNMGNLVLQGSLGGGQDSVFIKVADIPLSAGQVRQLSVDTSGLTGVEHLAFDFADVADTVVLTSSNFSNIATIEVKKGEADFHQVSIPDGTVFIVNSGLTLTVAQLLATDSISSVTGLGRLTIVADTASQLDNVATQIATKIAANPAFLIGFATAEPGYIEVKVGSTVVASNQTGVSVSSPDADGVALMNALAGGSLPSIPTLAASVNNLQAQITSGQTSITTLTANLATLQSAASALDAAYKTADTALDSRLDAAEAQLTNMSATVVTAINEAITTLKGSATSAGDTLGELQGLITAVNALVTTINTDKVDAFDTLGEVATAITTLQGLVTTLNGNTSVAGSVAKAVNDSFNTLTTNYTAAINEAITTLKGSATSAGDTLGELQGLITAVNALVTTINTDKVDAFDTLGEVATAITTLQGLVTTLNGNTSVAGSVAKAVNDSFNTLTTNYNAAITLAVDTLKGDVAAGYDTLGEIEDAILAVNALVTTLNGNTTVTGSVAKAVNDSFNTLTTNYTTAINSAVTILKGSATTAADTLGELEGLISAVNALVTTINTNKVDAFDTLGEVATAITTLQGLVTTLNGNTSVAGSVAKAVNDSFNTLTTNYNAAITLAVDTLKGDVAAGYDTLGEIEDAILAVNALVTTLNGNTTVTGSVAKAVNDSFNTLTTNYTTAINSAVTILKGSATTAADTLGELEGLISAVNALVTTINTNKVDAFDTLGEVATAITTLQGLVTTLNGNTSVAGSVAKAVNDSFNTLTTNYNAAITLAVDTLKGDVAAGYDTLGEIEDAILAVNALVTTLNGNTTVTGSVAKAVNDSFNTLTTNYTAAINEAITTLKGSATSAGDTLGELQGLITAVNALVTTINTDKVDAFDTLGEVATAITTLQGLVTTLNGNTSVAGSVAKAVNDSFNTLTTNYNAAITLAVDTLKGDVAAGYDTLGEIEDAILAVNALVTTLNGNTTVTGSVAKAVNDSFNTLTTNYQAAIKAVALVPTVSVFGGDLADGILETQEGSITVRVSLPQVAAANDTIQLYLNGSTSGSAYTVLSADVTAGFVDFTLAQGGLGGAGDKAISAKVTSGAITSNSSAGLYFTYSPDAAGPTAVATITDISADTGTSDSDYTTNASIQTVTGTLSVALAAGEKVQVSANGTNWFDATVGGTQWLAQVILASGTNNLQARTIDAAGNITAGAAAVSYTLDTTAPAAPAITDSQGADDNVVLTNDSTPALVITAATGSTVSVYMNGALVGNATESGTPGTFNFTSLALNDGVQHFTAKATDTAGNVSAASVSQALTVDTNAVAGVLSVADLSSGYGSPLNTSDPTFTLSLAGQEAGSTVTYQYKLDATDPAETDVSDWTNIAANATEQVVTGVDGRYDYRAKVVDAAGNISYSNIVTLNVTATPPTLDAEHLPTTALTSGGNSIGDTIALTITFDAPVNGLTSGTDTSIFKIAGTPVDAVWSGASGTNVRYLTYTVAANQNGLASIDEVALKTALIAGITNEGGIAFAYSGAINNVDATALPTVDGTKPTVTIAENNADEVVSDDDSTVTYTLTFSEEVDDLVMSDLSVTGGTLVADSLTQEDATTWTVQATATDGSVANLALTVKNTITDLPGNTLVQSSNTLTVDRVNPTVTIAMADTALKAGETSAVTFTFSEAVTGFANADLTIANGTLSDVITSDNGVTYTATFTPTADVEDAENIITVASTGWTDLAGNAPAAVTNSGNYAIDTKLPTVTIAITDAALKAGETTAVTFTFSEAVTGFTNADLTIENGTLTNVSTADGGVTYTATFTPTADVEDATNIITVGTGWTDVAGNAPAAAVDSSNYVIDTKRPTVSIAIADTALKANDTTTVTFTFSEAVTDFTNADVTVANGTLSVVSSSDGGVTYTGTFTPSVDTEDPTNIITVGTSWTDTAGNAPTAATDSGNYEIDTLLPTIAISAISGGYINAVEDDADLTISGTTTGAANGQTVTVAMGGSNYTATVSNNAWSVTVDAADVQALTEGTVAVTAGVSDVAGNAAVTGSTSFVYDKTAPSAPALAESVTTVTTGGYMNTAEAADATVFRVTLPAATTGIGSSATQVTESGYTQDGNGPLLTGYAGNSPTNAQVISRSAFGITGNDNASLGFTQLMFGSNGSATIDLDLPRAVLKGASDDSDNVDYYKLYLNADDVIQIVCGGDGMSNVVYGLLDATGALIQSTASNDAITYTASTSGYIYIGAAAGDSLSYVSGDPAPLQFSGGSNSSYGSIYYLSLSIDPAPVAGVAAGDKVDLLLNGEAFATPQTHTLTADDVTAGYVDFSVSASALGADGSKALTAVITDVAGNTGTASAATSFTLDRVSPTVTIAMADTALKAGETSAVTFTFSEAVTGFANADLTIANGTLSDVITSDNGVTYTATFTPTADVEDAENIITVASTGWTDLAGNAPAAVTNSGNYAIDTKLPTVTIAITDAALKAGETTAVTFTFSEAVTGFTNADLTIENGTLTNVSTADGGVTYTATFTPTADVEDATNIITVGTGWTDVAGNAPAAAVDSSNYVIDTKRPTVSIAIADTALKANDTTTVTFTFSEAVTDFTNADVTVANGTLSVVSSSDGGVTYTGTFTPSVDTEDPTNIITVGTSWTDTAGNAPTAATDSGNYEIDTLLPTIAISAISGGYINAVEDDADLTISGTTTGAANGQTVTVAMGGSNYTATVSNNAWSVTVDAADVQALTEGTVAVTAGVSDVAGNAAVTGSTSFVYDKTAPSAPALAESVTTVTTGGYMNTAEAADATVFRVTLPAATTGIGSSATQVTESGYTQDGNGPLLTGYAGNSPTNAQVISRSAFGITGNDNASLGFTQLMFGSNGSATIDLDLPRAVLKGASDDSDNVDYYKLYLNADDVIQIVCGGDGMSNVVYGLLDATGALIQSTASNDAITYTASTSGYIYIGAAAGDSLSYVSGDPAPLQFSGGSNSSYGSIYYLSLSIDPAPVAGVAAGDKVDLLLNGEAFATPQTHTLTADDVTAGYVDFSVSASALGADGSKALTAVITDVAGNTGTASAATSFTLDRVSPTVTIAMADTALKAGETSAVTFTFSEAVTGFANADLTIANGTLSDVITSDNGVTYTATFTPTADVEDAENIITVASTGWTDLAGNAPAAVTNSGNYAIDTKLPTVTIAITDAALKAGETTAVTFTFSEAVTGFTNADLTIENGTLTNVSTADGGVTYTATFTPTADVEDATNIITVGTGWTDVAGNAPAAAVDSSNYVIDTKRPTVTIVENNADGTVSDEDPTVAYTLTFSESVNDLVIGDLSVTGGAFVTDTLLKVSDTEWTVQATATDGSAADLVLTVKDSITDLSSNALVQSTNTLTVDRINPTVAASTDQSDGYFTVGETINITLTFPESVTLTGVNGLNVTLSTGDILNIAAAHLNDTNTVTAVYTVGAGDTSSDLTVTSVALGVDATLTDAAGNAASLASLTANIAASHAIVIDTTAPTLSSEAITAASGVQNSLLNAGDVVTVTATFDEAVVKTGEPRLALNIGGTTVYAAYSSGSGTSALTFTYTIQAGQTDVNGISIPQDALDLNGGTVTDLAGNTATITKAAVADNANYMVDTTVPTTPTIDVVASSDNGASSTDNISSIATPQVLVTLGAGAAVGDVVTLKAGSTTVGSFTLTQTEITNGNVTITTSDLGVQGTYALKAFATDAAGNVGADSNSISYVLDSSNDAPAVSFVSASATGFTILATDADSEPSWTSMSLATAVGGVSAVTDGANTTFNVAQQPSVVVTDLIVTDGSNQTQVEVGGQLVTLVLGTASSVSPNSLAPVSGYGLYYGFAGNDIIEGGENGNHVFGGDGNDTIYGGAGADFISGGAGSDNITLGAGVDTLLLDSLSGTDTIADFNPTDDLIQLAKSVLTGLGNVGALTDAQFESGAGLTVAVDSTTRIFYNETSGALYYDADGSGATAAVQVATLTGAPALTLNDLFIV